MVERISIIIKQLEEARRIAADNQSGEMVTYLIDLAIAEAEDERRQRSSDDEATSASYR